MRRIPLLSSLAASGLALAALASPVRGQTGGIPTISSRQFTAGSAKVTVTGAVQIDEDVPINTQASFGDGEMTWLQFGASGSDTPNALITYGNGEVGITVGKAKFIATGGIMPGEKSECSGTAEVTGTLVSGHYTCVGLVSHDAATSKMGKVNLEVRFTAKT